MFSTIKKELLLMFRDPAGLLLLIVMPAVLIVVMAVVQDGPFQDLHDAKFEVSVLNKDKGDAGKQLFQAINDSKTFDAVAANDEQTLRNNVREGKYKMGIIIPDNATKILLGTANKIVNNLSGGPAVFSENAALDSSKIELIYDPTLKPAFKNAFEFAVIQYVTQTKMDFLMGRLQKMSGNGGDSIQKIDPEIFNALSVKELKENSATVASSLNSVQHNVPAWAIFGMFLIVVPISGNMIREREEGSTTRLKLIPGAYAKSSMGTILFYTLFCILQFYIMMLIGIYVMPFVGLPSLSLGTHPWAVLPLVAAVAFCATAYGYFLGTVFKTANQSMPVGAISIVILASVGGVWVPLEILPSMVEKIAHISPLYWSLMGVNNIFLRGQGFLSTLTPTLVMFLSGVVLTVFSIFFSRRKRQ